MSSPQISVVGWLEHVAGELNRRAMTGSIAGPNRELLELVDIITEQAKRLEHVVRRLDGVLAVAEEYPGEASALTSKLRELEAELLTLAPSPPAHRRRERGEP